MGTLSGEDKKWVFATSTQRTIGVPTRYRVDITVSRAGFVLIIEKSWSALRNRGPTLELSVNFLVRSSYHILSS